MLMRAGTIVGLILAVTAADDATAADILPPLRVSAETSPARHNGERVLRIRSLLLRRVYGRLTVSCNGCPRWATPIRMTRPSPTSRRYTGMNWLLRGGRSIRITVERSGSVGRFVRLTIRGREGRLRLVYQDSGCLASRKPTRCAASEPGPTPGQSVPIQPPAPPAPAPASPPPRPPPRMAVATDDITINCTSTGQLCSPAYSRVVQTEGMLGLQFQNTDQACSELKVHVRLGNGQDAYVSEPLAAGKSFAYAFAPNVPAGTYTVVLQGEGMVSGCNTGQLYSWGGKLTITTTVPG